MTRSIYVSPPANQDALDHAFAGEWDFERTADHSGDPLTQLLIREGEGEEAQALQEQRMAWLHVVPTHEVQ